VHTSLLQAQIAVCDFQAARWLVDHAVPPQAGNDHPYSTPMGVLATVDGYINIGVGGDGQWQALCAAMERPDLAADPDYLTQTERFKHRNQLMPILAEMFAAETSAHWLALLERHGVPCGPIYKMDEVFADPQVRHLKMAEAVTHPDLGEIELVAQPLVLSRTPAAMMYPLPAKGAQTDDVLREAGYDDHSISRLRQSQVV
jgi:crotonobetainyl-CoA:carnitine CoA-transferase CaiB-like acyl-CoA transferase